MFWLNCIIIIFKEYYYNRRNLITLQRTITKFSWCCTFKVSICIFTSLYYITYHFFRAVYFYTYSSSKRFCNQLDIFVPNTAIVHMLSAGFAGFITATVINPVWLVKTRLQLHHGPLSIRECIKRIYQREGFKGYYKVRFIYVCP